MRNVIILGAILAGAAWGQCKPGFDPILGQLTSCASVTPATPPTAADQVLGSGASTTAFGTPQGVPNCGAGSALQYSTSAHAFSCGAGISACAATPPTAGTANSFCYDTSNVIWKCSNGASACTTSGQWVQQPGTFGQIDLPAFQICITAGCGLETTATRYPVAAAAGWTPADCSLNLAVAPTGSSVIVDVQTAAGTSIFGAAKLVFTTAGTSTTVIHQTTFTSTGGFFPLATDTLLKAVVTQNDSNGVAQFGYVRCH